MLKFFKLFFLFDSSFNGNKFILVTSAFHMPRAIKIFNSEVFNKNNSQVSVNYFKEHPSIKNIEQKIRATSKNIALAKQKYKPQFAVNVTYGSREDAINGNERTDLVSAGVTFDLPIFTSNKQDKDLEAAIFKTKSVKTEKFLQFRKLISSFETLKSALNRLKLRKNLYQNELLPQMNEQAEASLSAYTNDDGDFSEVVRSRISELNAKIDDLDINVEIQKNIIKLNYLFITKSTQILGAK